MISFRFHLVSIVAVFLALGLGVLAGTTVVNERVVEQLERQTDVLLEQNGQLRDRVDDLERQAEVWSSFGDQTMDHLVDGRLTGTEVVLVTQEGTDDDVIEAARGALSDGGADIRAVLSVRGRMALGDDGDAADLAEALDVPAASPDGLPELAAEALAARLALGPGTEDALQRLLAAGFVGTSGPGLDLGTVGRPDQVVVVVAGGSGEPAIDPQAFLVPLVERLVEDGGSVVAAESLRTRYDFVRILRGDGAVDGRIVTLDNVDQTPGKVGLVLALDLLVSEGRGGDYGVKGGADRLIPVP